MSDFRENEDVEMSGSDAEESSPHYTGIAPEPRLLEDVDFEKLSPNVSQEQIP